MNYFALVIAALLALIFVYFVARFASVAYYRSKREFIERTHRKGDRNE